MSKKYIGRRSFLRARQHRRSCRALFVNVNSVDILTVTAYVTSRFPSVDVSSVKQVLAYKCKENSTALKMKSIRYIW